MSCKWRDICPLRRLEKEGLIGFKWDREYCLSRDNWKSCKRYEAEEKGVSHSDYLMPDGSYLNKDE
jgi:hypothetical protein